MTFCSPELREKGRERSEDRRLSSGEDFFWIVLESWRSNGGCEERGWVRGKWPFKKWNPFKMFDKEREELK